MEVGTLQPTYLILAALVLFTEVAIVVVHLVDGFAIVVVVDLVHLVLPLSPPLFSPLPARVGRVAVPVVVVVPVVSVMVVVVVVTVVRGSRYPQLRLVGDRFPLLRLVARWNRGRTLPVGEVRCRWRLCLALLLLLNLNSLDILKDPASRCTFEQDPGPNSERRTGRRKRPWRAPRMITRKTILKKVTKM